MRKGNDLEVLDHRAPIAVEEVLAAAEFDAEDWLVFFDETFETAAADERHDLIRNPVDLGRLIFTIPDEPLRDASPPVCELIGALVTEKLRLRLPAIT